MTLPKARGADVLCTIFAVVIVAGVIFSILRGGVERQAERSPTPRLDSLYAALAGPSDDSILNSLIEVRKELYLLCLDLAAMQQKPSEVCDI